MKIAVIIIILSHIFVHNLYAESVPVNKSEYNQKNFELAAIFYGVVEIGGQSCKAAGKSMPKSLEKWWTVVKNYQQNESALMTKTENDQNELLNELENSKDNLQFDSLKVQEKSIDIGINAIAGAGGRIPLREDLLKAIAEIKKMIAEEKEKSILSFNNFKDKAIPDGINIAKKACERTKKEKICTTNESGEDNCVESEVKDPVPGCDVAIKNYSAILPMLEDYKKLFLMTQVPSTELNTKMDEIEKNIQDLINNTPLSNDSNFDWSTNVSNKYLAMQEVRKDQGILCPSSDGESQLDRSELNKIVPTKNAQKGTSSEKVANASVNFLNAIGANVDSNNATSTFSGTWNLADTVIGQPGQRALYFDYIAEKLNDVLVMDDQHLSNATAAKEDVHNYAEKVESELQKGSTFEAATAVAKQSSNLSTSLNNFNNALAFDNSSLISSVGMNAIENVAKIKKGASDSSNGGSGSFAGVNTTSSGNSLSGSGVGNANNSNAVDKKNSNKNSTEGGSGSFVSKNNKDNLTEKDSLEDQDKKLNSKKRDRLSEFNIKFTHKNNESNVFAQKQNSVFNNFKNSPESEKVYEVASYRYKSKNRSEGDYNLNPTSSKKVANKTKVKKGKGYVNEFVEVKPPKRTSKRADTRRNVKYDRTSEDAQILSNAINAKKRNSDSYKSKEDDTLFDILTKAYIRNYERIEN